MRGEIDRLAAWLDPGTLIGALALGGVLILVGVALTWLIRRGLVAALDHDKSDRVDQITLSFVSHLSVMITWVLLLALYAHLVPALNRLGTALLAGVGLMSVIVGFAAQTTLGNLVSGISLVLYKPFRRGDRLQVPGPTADQFAVGVVEDVTLGFTTLRTDDGNEIIVANGTMAQQTMIKLAPAPKPAPKASGTQPKSK